jgi:hypothetical protein
MSNTRQPGVQGMNSGAASALPGRGRVAAAPARGLTDVRTATEPPLTPEQQTLLLDLTQIALDVAGIFEPTPFADLTNASISTVRSDWTGAGISLLGTIPYVGDAAKAGKFPRYLKTLERVIAEAQFSAPFLRVARPLLLRVYSHMDAVQAIMPAAARSHFSALRGRLALVLGNSGRVARARQLIRTLRSRLEDPDDVLDTMEALLSQTTPGRGTALADDLLADLLANLDNFGGIPKIRLLKAPELAVRASDTVGGAIADGSLKTGARVANDMGRYLVPGTDLIRAADRKASAVSFDWNKMNALEVQQLPKGALVIEGLVKAQANLPGGGAQIFHFGHLSTSGQLLPPAERTIVDGVTRLLGGTLTPSH